MTPEIAKKLLPLVNVKRTVDLMELYADMRIAEAHKLMEQSDDLRVIQMAQGAIKELRRFKTLRDEGQAKAEGCKKRKKGELLQGGELNMVSQNTKRLVES